MRGGAPVHDEASTTVDGSVRTGAVDEVVVSPTVATVAGVPDAPHAQRKTTNAHSTRSFKFQTTLLFGTDRS